MSFATAIAIVALLVAAGAFIEAWRTRQGMKAIASMAVMQLVAADNLKEGVEKLSSELESSTREYEKRALHERRTVA